MGKEGIKKSETKPIENKQNNEKKVREEQKQERVRIKPATSKKGLKGDESNVSETKVQSGSKAKEAKDPKKQNKAAALNAAETQSESKIKGEKRTQIAEIGKSVLLQRLFDGTGYINAGTQKFENKEGVFITTSSIMLEGVDFDLIYTPLKHLGYKSALLAMGPIYANCYNPKGLAYQLGISARFSAEDVVEFWTGVVAAAKEHGVERLGLELNASMTGLAIGVAAQGEQERKMIIGLPETDKNSLVCITGNVGAAYMGLHVLKREKVAFNKMSASQAAYVQPDLSKYKYILSQYLSPEINPKMIEQFKEAGIFPSAGYFITKGLAQAVKQVCADTGFGARIYLDKIPIASPTFAMAQEIQMDAITAALNGGDDYKFLFIIPLAEHEKFHKEFPNVDIIGHLTAKENGVTLVTPEGAALEIKSL